MTVSGRAPQGARGLKSFVSLTTRAVNRRAPQGARGLKFLLAQLGCLNLRSRPARGAWIEMYLQIAVGDNLFVAPRKGRVD